MHEIKVMLASRPKMISDVIRNIIDRQSDMVTVGDVVDPIKLLSATRETRVDVVIVTSLKSAGEPKICNHLLAEHPRIKIIVLIDEGKTIFVHKPDSAKEKINAPSTETIVNIIREPVL